MRRVSLLGSVVLVALLALAPAAWSQAGPQWRPSTTQMPMMPTMAELQNGWTTSLAAWFTGIEAVTGASAQGLRANGTGRSGSNHTQVARFLRGPVPVVVMTDRNGDDRADMIEYFRDGTLVIQVIDADYSGRANSMRVYDASGALLREDRF